MVAFAALQYLSASSHNFYVGANLGLNTMTGKRNDAANNRNNTLTQFTNNKSINTNNVFGGIFTGYLFRISNFGIGPEFFYNYGNIENIISGRHVDIPPLGGGDVTVFDVKYRLVSQYGINAKFAYFLKSYLLYALVGIQFQSGNFQVKARQDRGLQNLPERDHRTKFKSTNGFSFGIGGQKQINENYDIGLEYKVINFPRKNYEFFVDDQERTKLSSDIKYKIHSIGLRFIYKF